MTCRALLVVDRRFLLRGDGIFTAGPVGAETGERYLEWFDEVVVAGRQLADLGHDTTKLTRISSNRLRVEFLPDISGLPLRVRNVKSARRCLQSLMAQSDCVIARLPTELGAEAAELALASKVPLAIDLGGCVLEGYRGHGSFKGQIYAPVAYRRLRKIVARAAWVSYVTESALQRRYPAAADAHTVAVSNVEIATPSTSILTQRLSTIRPEKTLVFGTIGSPALKYKGIHVAISALAHAKDRLPKFTYRVLGGGTQTAILQHAAHQGLAENLAFDGILPSGAAVRHWLDDIDVYLQPSLTEGVPRALVEAMSRGCPALGSNVGGIPELLGPDFLHMPGDSRSLAEGLVRMSNLDVRRACATTNWTKSFDYSHALLHARRSSFWLGFRQGLHCSQSCYLAE